jgi:hypothetical protein
MTNYGTEMKYTLIIFFAYAIAIDELTEKDYVLKTAEECMHKNDWSKWKDVMKVELDSLEK